MKLTRFDMMEIIRKEKELYKQWSSLDSTIDGHVDVMSETLINQKLGKKQGKVLVLDQHMLNEERIADDVEAVLRVNSFASKTSVAKHFASLVEAMVEGSYTIEPVETKLGFNGWLVCVDAE